MRKFFVKLIQLVNKEKSLNYHFEDYISMLLLVFLVLVVLFQALSRFLFSSPPLWTEEVARYLLIIITFVGAPIAIRNGSNVSLDFLLKKLPENTRFFFSILSQVLELVFYFTGVLLAFKMTIFSEGRFLVSIHISRMWIYGIIAFGFCLMAVRCILNIYFSINIFFKNRSM